MMKPKILFIELPIDFWNRLGRHYLPNAGTLAIASYMKVKGYHVKILDTYAEGIGWKKLEEVIRRENPDIVGSSSYTADIYGRILLARLIKKINPRIRTIVGGGHMSLVPEETLFLAKAIDYGVIGEGEETFLELVQAIERGERETDIALIKGIAYIRDGKYIYNGPRARIEDLDQLPMPDYSLLPMSRYRNSYFPLPAQEGFSCYFSRGCVAPCNFCSESILWQHQWRGRSPELIVEEFAMLNKQYGKKGFILGDHDFLFSRKRNMEFIEQMKKSGLQIMFRAGARVDTLFRNKDLLADLRQVGMVSVQIGIESFKQAGIDDLNKKYDVGRIETLMQELKKADIMLSSAFMIIGLYEDDAKTIKDLPRQALKLGFGLMQISTLTPWPGTRLYEEMERKGLIKEYDYRKYNMKTAVADTKYLTIRQLQQLRPSLFSKWWFSFSVLLRNIPNKYRRHIHFYSVWSVFTTALFYHFINNRKLWKLFLHNRLIDQIYQEHMAYRREKKLGMPDATP